ncbi:proline-rich protein HaeIII subfamily 1-like [Empidonax traillii]|uniref:proline-rich protein HaeIII subfamily 1-like n=1 Tax=Empidonax traillii TaxID=164674 RepID=UPI000FFD480E|nr:proline-rich protein HaeIII subfamily 1-like [Empidonax traillii]
MGTREWPRRGRGRAPFISIAPPGQPARPGGKLPRTPPGRGDRHGHGRAFVRRQRCPGITGGDTEGQPRSPDRPPSARGWPSPGGRRAPRPRAAPPPAQPKRGTAKCEGGRAVPAPRGIARQRQAADPDWPKLRMPRARRPLPRRPRRLCPSPGRRGRPSQRGYPCWKHSWGKLPRRKSTLDPRSSPRLLLRSRNRCAALRHKHSISEQDGQKQRGAEGTFKSRGRREEPTSGGLGGEERRTLGQGGCQTAARVRQSEPSTRDSSEGGQEDYDAPKLNPPTHYYPGQQQPPKATPWERGGGG